jgi:hypothetical protein
MTRFWKPALVALAFGGIVLAAPTFSFSTSASMNAMMSKDVIQLTAYPKLKLLSRDIMGSKATLTYTGSDAKGAFAYYEAAFKKEGWKSGDAMMAKPDAMMSKDEKFAGKYTLAKHALEITVNSKDGKTVAQFSVK